VVDDEEDFAALVSRLPQPTRSPPSGRALIAARRGADVIVLTSRCPADGLGPRGAPAHSASRSSSDRAGPSRAGSTACGYGGFLQKPTGIEQPAAIEVAAIRSVVAERRRRGGRG
jgi:hypothetical protein